MLITRKSPFTGKVHTMDLDVTEEQMRIFASPSRPLIQDLFPHLSADEREFIKTGITPAEWAATFSSEND